MVGGSLLSESTASNTVFVDYKFERIGYTDSSILKQSGDILMLWMALFVLYAIFYAIEFVFDSVPYVRTIC